MLIPGVGFLTGCRPPDSSEADRCIPSSNTVFEVYRITLDEKATPQQVAWVFLKTLSNDIHAGNNRDRRTELLKQECALTNIEAYREKIQGAHSTTDFNEWLFQQIYHWAPGVSYYVDYFDPDFESAAARMTVQFGRAVAADTRKSLKTAYVDYVIPSEANGGPAGLSMGATIRITLAQTSQGLWRVMELTYGSVPEMKRPVPASVEVPHDDSSKP